MSKTIGIIGLGSIGMRHAENLQKMGHNWVFHDPANENGFSLKRLFADDVDAVVIASPTPQHFDDIMACRSAGKPLLVEKPIAHGYHSFLKDVTMVGYNLRFHGCVKKAKEWLDAGRIGDPLWANFTLGQRSIKPPYLRDGVILNWSHEIDLALYLLGPATVSGSSTRLRPTGLVGKETNRPDGQDISYCQPSTDDMTDILLTHKRGGCRTTVHLDYITTPEVRQFMIQGSLGSINVNFVERFAWVDSADGKHDDFSTEATWNDTYIEEMQAFLDRIDGKNTIGCTGEEGLKVLKICLEVRKQAGLE